MTITPTIRERLRKLFCGHPPQARVYVGPTTYGCRKCGMGRSRP